MTPEDVGLRDLQDYVSQYKMPVGAAHTFGSIMNLISLDEEAKSITDLEAQRLRALLKEHRELWMGVQPLSNW